jgi:phage/conjugal plasmid C-4 type zinc finger TraR family protein
MPDVVDIAQEINEQFQQDALAEHLRRGVRNAGRLALGECLDCGGKIPAERRKAVPGVTLCVSCQSKNENLPHRRSL